MVSPRDAHSDPRNTMKQKQTGTRANARHVATSDIQPMCGGKAIHKFLSKKGPKQLPKQHENQGRHGGVPSMTSSDTSSSVELNQDRNQGTYRMPLGPNKQQSREYDHMPSPPPYLNESSYENIPPEMKTSHHKSYGHHHKPEAVLKLPGGVEQKTLNGSSNNHRSSPTWSKDTGQLMQAFDRLADFDDNVDDHVKLAALRSMRDVVIQQQETLKAMSTQNHTYRRKLGVAQNKFHSFHKCQMDQMSMIEKLQMEKDAFESEALLLREENTIMRQEIERLKKRISRETETRPHGQAGRHKNQLITALNSNPADAANWNSQREWDFKAAGIPLQSHYHKTEENLYPSALPNQGTSSNQRNVQGMLVQSINAPDPPEEKYHDPRAADNSRREEYLQDMEYVRKLMAKYETDEMEESFEDDVGNNADAYRNLEFEHQRQAQTLSKHQLHNQSTSPARAPGGRAPGRSINVDPSVRSAYENLSRAPNSRSYQSSMPANTGDLPSQTAQTMHYPAKSENRRAKQFAKALNNRRGQVGSQKEEEMMAWRSSSPGDVGTPARPQRNLSDIQEPSSSDWEEEDSDSLATIGRKRENHLGAVPFSVQNMTSLDGISEQDRHILTAAAYHSRVSKTMHQNNQF